MPYPGLLYPKPLPLQQPTADPLLHRRYSNTVLSQSLWGLWVLVRTKFVWALRVSLEGMGLDSKHNFTPPTILLGCLFPLPLDVGYLFLVGSNIFQSTVVQQQVGVLAGEDELTSFYSSILHFRKFKKQNLNLPHSNNYLHSIYIVFTTIYTAFTWY